MVAIIERAETFLLVGQLDRENGMKITTIRLGSRGPLVQTWQDFLRGEGVYLGASDGIFGPKTEAATKTYQFAEDLYPIDGIVGNITWGAAMADGLQLVGNDSTDRQGPNWPPLPDDLHALNPQKRAEIFGNFQYRPAPTERNPEGIQILGSWVQDNITNVVLPQLKGVLGAPSNGRILWHKKGALQVEALFQGWEKAGLVNLVKSWAGSWNPRFSRGSRTILSNHSYATAFDINVPGNGLRKQPALVGQPWSVRELVPLAENLGFWWGGWWGYPDERGFRGRSDGMHFELAKVLTPKQIQDVLDAISEPDPY